MSINLKRMPYALIIGLLALAAAQAQESRSFTNTLNAGLTLTDGNSESLLVNASLLSVGEQVGLGSVRAGVEVNYGEATVNSNKGTTVNNIRGFANAKKTITPMTFGYLDGSVVHDDIAEIDYRITIGPGLGAYLLKNDKATFSAEIGPSYIWEKVAGVSDDYLAPRLAERLDYALSPTAKIWQSAEILPKIDDFNDYLLNAELGASAALNTLLDLRIVLQDKYDHTPREGLDKNDLILIAGIGVKL